MLGAISTFFLLLQLVFQERGMMKYVEPCVIVRQSKVIDKVSSQAYFNTRYAFQTRYGEHALKLYILVAEPGVRAKPGLDTLCERMVIPLKLSSSAKAIL
jgi:hypothetical protein